MFIFRKSSIGSREVLRDANKISTNLRSRILSDSISRVTSPSTVACQLRWKSQAREIVIISCESVATRFARTLAIPTPIRSFAESMRPRARAYYLSQSKETGILVARRDRRGRTLPTISQGKIRVDPIARATHPATPSLAAVRA